MIKIANDQKRDRKNRIFLHIYVQLCKIGAKKNKLLFNNDTVGTRFTPEVIVIPQTFEISRTILQSGTVIKRRVYLEQSIRKAFCQNRLFYFRESERGTLTRIPDKVQEAFKNDPCSIQFPLGRIASYMRSRYIYLIQ